MTSYPAFPIGIPGIKTARSCTPRDPLFSLQGLQVLAHAGVIDGTKSRDAQNTGDLGTLRGGMAMGRVTSGGKWAPSILGVSDVAYSSGTSLSLAETTGDEVVRRIGTSGTFKITGPPTAGGTTRTLTATFSAVAAAGSGHRVATITALGAAQVDRINFNLASTAGNLQLRIQKPDGTFATTGSAAWNATDATYLAAINTVLDAATGVAGAIVATAISAVDPDLGIELTYALSSYPTGATAAQVALFPTTSTVAVYTRITTAVDNRFVTGSLIQPTDGSETIRAIQGDPWGVRVLDDDATSTDAQFSKPIIGGFLDTSKLTNYPSDTGLISWYQTQLNTYGHFTFSTNFQS